jgi:pyruvate/2-oxoglutarate dehydrogenase complex dihydrolipoamide dehydrogenase (E3) component
VDSLKALDLSRPIREADSSTAAINATLALSGEKVIQAGDILVATGRTPNTTEIGLEFVGATYRK